MTFCLRQLAEYREHFREIQLAGESVAAVLVDSPEQSEALRVDLALPFPILCDTERRVVRERGIYNGPERGGIAKSAVFVIDSGRVVRFASLATVVRRVSAAEILSLLKNKKPVMFPKSGHCPSSLT